MGEVGNEVGEVAGIDLHHHGLFILPSINVHLSCFKFQATDNTQWISVYLLLCTCVSITLG